MGLSPEAADGVLADLRRSQLVPADCVAVVCVGSVARGWANPGSDVDINVVTSEPARVPGARSLTVRLKPACVPTVSIHDYSRPYELKFWTTGQIEQLLRLVSWENFERGGGTAAFLPSTEELCLERFLTCAPLLGAEWVQELSRRIEESAFRAFVTVRSLAGADAAVEDVEGQLRAGDVESAVLSARRAWGHIVDAVLESRGVFGATQPKWRARRVRDACLSEFSFDDYWRVETMRDLDLHEPAAWAEDVVRRTRQLTLDVEIG